MNAPISHIDDCLKTEWIGWEVYKSIGLRKNRQIPDAIYCIKQLIRKWNFPDIGIKKNCSLINMILPLVITQKRIWQIRKILRMKKSIGITWGDRGCFWIHRWSMKPHKFFCSIRHIWGFSCDFSWSKGMTSNNKLTEFFPILF